VDMVLLPKKKILKTILHIIIEKYKEGEIITITL
jgi:hypothetical protein